jgi:hypothetical protein
VAKTFTILFAVEDDISSDKMVQDLDEAVNEYGLIGGNFIIVNEEANDKRFWKIWGARMSAEKKNA